MSFALNGTHINGGTFNNVSGNVTQVFNSHVSHVGLSMGAEPGDGFLASATTSIGAIRTDRVSRHRNGEPYAINERRHRQDHHQSELSHRNVNSTSGYVHGSRAVIAPTQHDIYTPIHAPASSFDSSHLQQSNPFHPVSNGYDGGWTNISPGHDAIPAPVQHDLVPAYSGNQANSDASQSQRSAIPFHRDMNSYQAPPRFPETITNHTYNSVGGDMTQFSVTSYGESGIDILYRYVVMEALHDSGERFPEPACHPGTRTDILDQLRSWSLDTNPESMLLWLHGSAGMGKSAIAQMFAGECDKEGRLGASFFFRRGHPRRGTWHGLITTIAYQLAKSVLEFLLPLQQVIETDKLVVGRAIPV
ncbi:hypothetical protein C8R44DRAFT_699026 [Mycena epipterygia]|nr:hypothetical protein C8R44DRAFT_699026 [Mycena epipterygia]